MAGQRETVPLSPLPRLLRQEEFREVTGTQTEEYSEPPHPEVSRVDDDISRPPSPAPSSPGEEPGRQKDDESDSSPDLSQDSWEDLPDSSSESDSEDLLGLDLERYQALQPCSAGPPHCCKEYFWDTCTFEESELIVKWAHHCRAQLQAGEQLRPDIERDENGKFIFPFHCSLLKELRKIKNKQTRKKFKP